MSAPVTEAHRELARTIRLHVTLGQAYQLIADSEAKAVVEIAMVAAESADRNVSLRLERDQLRTEIAQLQKNCTDIYDAGRKTEDQLRAEVEQWELAFQEQYARAERAEAELADIRALANRRNKRDHSQDTTHQLVAALDQALDIAQAELATERARLDWLELRGPWDSWNGFGETGITLRENIRAAIDAAIKDGA